MSKPLEDYGFIGNLHTGALVARDGAIDWLCLPRFDGGACFAALLGGAGQGYWQVAPEGGVERTTRRYLDATLVLETTFVTAEGTALLIDFMPLGGDKNETEIVRLVRGVKGRVPMRMTFVPRFGYGRTIPWLRRRDDGLSAVAGPDAVELVTPVALAEREGAVTAAFAVAEGETVPFTLAYHPTLEPQRPVSDPREALADTLTRWRDWIGRCGLPQTDHADAARRSLALLKALTYRPSGAIVAAATTSLPEHIGGKRNWDYRYCWIRDATFTLLTLLHSGYREEARDWRGWLLRAAAGEPSQLQIMYGLTGERDLPERELDWLPGYAGSRPVRTGNGASHQFQLDLFGELIDALYVARREGLEADGDGWRLQRALLDHLETVWERPDQGLWESRGEPKQFTYSKVMAWVAFDRAVRSVENWNLDGPVGRWRELREKIRAQVLERGWNARKGSFVQHYATEELDASALLIPQLGFLPWDDPRVLGTIAAVERELAEDGLVWRYRPGESEGGAFGAEGAFVACGFWLADAYAMTGQRDKALAQFERNAGLRNDLGLLSEEYDPGRKRLIGNIPQALSHIGLVNTAHNLAGGDGPAAKRAG